MAIFENFHFSSLIFSARQRFSTNIFGFLDYLGDKDQKCISTSVEYLWRKEISQLKVAIFEKYTLFDGVNPATPKV